jgi:hypothetical protein
MKKNHYYKEDFKGGKDKIHEFIKENLEKKSLTQYQINCVIAAHNRKGLDLQIQYFEKLKELKTNQVICSLDPKSIKNLKDNKVKKHVKDTLKMALKSLKKIKKYLISF